jgi:hypothetical protein
MSLPTKITYNDTIKEDIVASGGTIIFIKDNIIVASEISEEHYRILLDSPYISKIDVLPLKRYKNETQEYTAGNLDDFNITYGENQLDQFLS